MSTTYVPLQAPYQIIKYGSDIGMQIGTLIATKEIEGDESCPFRIETHSYPVVAYEDKMKASMGKNLFSHHFMEGVVWNRVELHDVSTVCMVNARLPWQEFIDFLWEDHLRSEVEAPFQIHSMRRLKELGVQIELPAPGTYTLNLSATPHDDSKLMVSTAREDFLALDIVWSGNVDELVQSVIDGVRRYLPYLSPNSTTDRWQLAFATKDEQLNEVVERLNANRRATHFGSHFASASFTVRAVRPYKK